MTGRKDETVGGFSVPLQLRVRKQRIDEAMRMNPDLGVGGVVAFLGAVEESAVPRVCEMLDGLDYVGFADAVREHSARSVIRARVSEIVRKKPGGGGYVLYSPNRGKKKKPVPVGEFPTKLGAKRAELARFPPRDPGKLKRLRKEIDRFVRDPEKAARSERMAAMKDPPESREKAPSRSKPKPKKKDESTERDLLRGLVAEALFYEESAGSEWEDQMSRLPPKALTGDRRLQGLQKNIEKKTEGVLQDAVRAIKRALKKDVKMKDFGIKKSDDGKTYTAFSATMDNVEVGPVYVYVEKGVPKIEVSDSAKAALTKCDPANAKLFRAELVTVQERVLDRVEDLTRAIESRDRYLTKIQDDVDTFVAGLTPLQVSLLKDLLTKKYRRQ